MAVTFDRMYEAGEFEAELVPQGTFAKRIRATACGIDGFYTDTAIAEERSTAAATSLRSPAIGLSTATNLVATGSHV